MAGLLCHEHKSLTAREIVRAPPSVLLRRPPQGHLEKVRQCLKDDLKFLTSQPLGKVKMPRTTFGKS